MNNNINVFIIDDDDIYQFTMTINLKTLNSVGNISVFNDGSEAIDFLIDKLNDQNKLPDVIFLDINMPVMDGFQFMEEYVKIESKINKKITIYMVSSSVDPVDIEKSNQINEIAGYIMKPIKQHQLAEILKNL